MSSSQAGKLVLACPGSAHFSLPLASFRLVFALVPILARALAQGQMQMYQVFSFALLTLAMAKVWLHAADSCRLQGHVPGCVVPGGNVMLG